MTVSCNAGEGAVESGHGFIVRPPRDVEPAIVPPSSDRFEQLLTQLQRVHIDEVGNLHDEIQRLRNDLRVSHCAREEPVQPSIVFDGGSHRVTISSAVSFSNHGDENEAAAEAPNSWWTLKADWLPTAKPTGAYGTWSHHLDRRDGKHNMLTPLQGVNTHEKLEGPLSPRSSRWIIHPSSNVKTMWDIGGLLLIIYDMIMIPFQVFNPPDNVFLTGMKFTTLIFWTCDIFASLSTGYYFKGEVVLNRKMIVKNYLKTWFAIDFLVVCPDWTLTLMSNGQSNVAGYGRVFRAARALRVLRLLRLAKVQRILNIVYDTLDSEHSFIIVSLFKLLSFIFVLNHVIACIWYYIGSVGRGWGAKNWLEDAGKRPVETLVEYESDNDRFITWTYTTSLHWSLTQFTPAGMDVSACNVVERTFSVAVLFFALVAFSSVIGSVTASMAALRNLTGGNMKELWLLRRYLKQKKVSPELSGRVEKYLDHQIGTKQNAVKLTQIPVMKELSEQLQIELACEMHNHHLMDHPVFKYIHEHMRQVMYRICHHVLKPCSFAPEDYVFRCDDECRMMYFVRSGLFEYKSSDGITLDPPLRTNAWLSEAVLWTVAWRHRGDFQADSPSELVSVLPDKFSEVMHMHPRPWYFAKEYAEKFVKYVAEAGPTTVSDVIFSPELFEHLDVGDKNYFNFHRSGSKASLRAVPFEHCITDVSDIQDLPGLPGATTPWRLTMASNSSS